MPASIPGREQSMTPHRSWDRFQYVFNGVAFFGVISTALFQMFLSPVAPLVWLTLFAGFTVVNARRLRRSGLFLLGTALVIAAALLAAGQLPSDAGITQASLLFSLLLLVQYLGRMAEGSEDVARGARMIVSRPPGQRYAFLTIGTHILCIFLHMGGMLFVMTLVALRQKLERPETIRAMALSAMRGFAATALWSPLSLSVVVILSGVTGVSYLQLAPVGLAATVAFLFTGYLMERRHRASTAAPLRLTREEWHIVLRLIAPVVLLIAAVMSSVAVFGLRLIEGVFSASLIMGGLWSLALFARRLLDRRSLLRTASTVTASVTNEVVIICAAVAIGTLAASALMGSGQFSQGLTPREAVVAAGLVPLLIVAGGIVALNPLVMVTLLAGTLNAIWPEDAKLWLVLALSWGWAAASCGTPLTANMLLAAQRLKVSPYTMAFAWNGRFTALTTSVAVVILVIGTWGSLR